MPRTKKTLKLKVQTKHKFESAEDLEGFIKEASEIKNLTETKGWHILERDLMDYKTRIGQQIAYLNPKSPQFEEARVLYIASDKLLAMVSDYEENRAKAIELLTKLENPNLAVAMDVDNE